MSKSEYAQIVSDRDDNLQAGMTGCEIYGMAWGCDEDCPVLLSSECELQDTENKELYKAAMKEQGNV